MNERSVPPFMSQLRALTSSVVLVGVLFTSSAMAERSPADGHSRAGKDVARKPRKDTGPAAHRGQTAKEGDSNTRERKAEPADRGAPEETVRPKRRPANELLRKRRAALREYRAAMDSVDKAEDSSEGEPGPTVRRARKAMKEARSEFQDVNRKRAVRFLKMSPAKKKAFRDRLQAQKKKLRAERKTYAKARRTKLKGRLGSKAKLPRVRNELRRHTWRVARLTRLIDIAEAALRADAKKRATDLLAKEHERHQRRLSELLQGTEPKSGKPKTERGASQ